MPGRLRVLLLVPLGAAVALAAVACGSSPKATVAGAAGTTTTTDPRAAYRSCLAQHGVNLPARDPGGNGPRPTDPGATSGPRPSITLPAGVDQATFDAARQACASLQPAAGGNGARGQAFQAYASCLQDHGVTVPTTGGATTGGPGGGFRGIDRSDPAFQAADQVCAPLRPTTTMPGTTTIPDTTVTSTPASP